MTRKLPTPIQEKILSFPEYRMGAHKVALKMRNGALVEDVIVAWGNEVVRVGGVNGCLIDPNDVVEVENRS
jgi:hypothetical protein